MTCQLIPIQLSDAQKGQVCGILSVGCDWQTAAGFVGCSLADLRWFIREDQEFALSVRRAQAGTELSHMRNIQQAAQDAKNWRASVWWLERHSPERFGHRGAGVVTSRQIKGFIEILSDILRQNVKSSDDRKQVINRLTSLSSSIDKLLRDPAENDPDSGEMGDQQSADGAEDQTFEAFSDDADNFSDGTLL